MSSKTFQISVMTPTSCLHESTSHSAKLPGIDGLIGVLPGHTTLITLLGYGLLSINNNETKVLFIIDGGFAKITPQKVDILANHAEKVEDIDRELAVQAYKNALELKPKGEIELKERLHKIAIARTRMKYGKKLGE